MRALLLLFVGLTGVVAPAVQAQDEAHMDGRIMLHADAAGLSGVDRRLIVCRKNAGVLRTTWVIPAEPVVNHPQVCNGGANRLGAGYVRYLSTNRVTKGHPRLRG
ncbi:hypothetical protein JK185_06500 [Gluconobacter wancherniae]|uniref:hypothetical protein n=1 Tax=Gluconobacter wancherniae TaxID=1307955 RepID=UPI001B8C6DC2|nr:hypothetical protein [Gluconobacter wancherniae]MBS1062708.1 hypothetical protein [Gluconobacter wancherniae]